MARSAILSVAAVVAAVVAVTPDARPRPEPARTPSERIAPLLPAIEAADDLPPLPERSLRTASYDIEARLDPVAHAITGRLVLNWKNPSTEAQDRFPFHLYWNAYRNTLSTMARETRGLGGPLLASSEDDGERFGFIHVRSIRAGDEDLTPALQFIQPDDGNLDDRTLAEVQIGHAVGPGETVQFEIEWEARIPHGSLGRSGYVHDYNFIAQWFPKIAALREGKWNRHQFHAHSEFFANFGNYDVRLTVPRGFEVGATGRVEGRRENADGTVTFRFVQEDVHDFAWVTSQRLRVRTGHFVAPGYPSVDLRLLVQPEHEHLAERYFEATRVALRAFGAWSAPYPYRQITIVDPAWGSASGGMEYPTLFTAGTRGLAPKQLHEPESVTIHECGHQFWYGLVATNESDEPWLDEGFTTYHTAKAEELAYGPQGQGRRYFGAHGAPGWPIVAPGVHWSRGGRAARDVEEWGQQDPIRRRAWEYRNGSSYGANAYAKSALTLQTLEGLVGDATMTRILRTYARRYRFAHPTTADFVTTVEEVTGRSWQAFFEETFESSDLVDYAVSVSHEPAEPIRGFVDGVGGNPTPSYRGGEQAPETSVVVERRGGARLPVDLVVEFADGKRVREIWDGQERWKRFRYAKGTVSAATVDPDGAISLDVDRSNNRWSARQTPATREAWRGGSRFLFFLQNLLLTHEVLG